MPFIPHPDADKRRRSAKAVIRSLLLLNSPDILPKHIRDLIDTMLWKLTEADGKYNTRYRSEGATLVRDAGLLHHEHVFPKKAMIDALLEAKSNDEVDLILEAAIGCTVTREEHARLYRYQDEAGWQRYRSAGVAVIDCATNERVENGG